MSRAWGIGCEDTVECCCHCGARYAVRITRLTARADRHVYCDVCWQELDAGASILEPSYTLIERPGPKD
jgi:hypothetical protein